MSIIPLIASGDNGVDIIAPGQERLSNSITFSRSSPRGAYNSSAIYYTPQMLVTETTNNFIRNSAAQGASAGTPGTMPTYWSVQVASGITQQIVSTTDGLEVRFSGTPATSPAFIVYFEGNNNIAAANTDVRTTSVHLTRTAGSNTNISAMTIRNIQRDSGGLTVGSELIGTSLIGSLTGSETRFQSTFTMNNASTAFVTPYLVGSWTSGAIDITIKIRGPQEEKRSSASPYIETTGVARSVIVTTEVDATNTGTLDFNPTTLEARGFVVEEERTNSIRNSIFAGGTAGTIGSGAVVPSNMSITLGTGATGVISFGTEFGMEYMEVAVSGTVSTSPSLSVLFEASTGIAATVGQTWTNSVSMRLSAGSLTNIGNITLRHIERNSGGTNIATNISSDVKQTITSGIVRNSYTATLAQATVAFVQPLVAVSHTGTVALSYTLRFYGPQEELGAFATSYIRSTGSAATRATERGLISNLNGLVGTSEGTLVIDHEPLIVPASDNAIVSLSDNTANNSIRATIQSDGTANQPVVTGGVAQTTFTGRSNVIAGAVNRTIIAWKNNDFAVVNNGESIAVDTSGTVPTVTQLAFGDNGYNTSNHYNGWYRRITSYQTKFTTTEIANAAKQAQSVNTIIIIGQSNADGRGDNTTISNATRNFYAGSRPNLFCYHKPTLLASGNTVDAANFTDDGTWWRLGFGYSTTRTETHQNVGATVGQGVATNTPINHGVELPLARLHQQAYPNRELRIIKCGVSGSGIEANWKITNADSGFLWDYFKNYIYTPAVNDMLAQGKTPNIIGVFWMQGEADANSTDAPLYQGRLQTLVTRLNTELFMVPNKIAIGRLGATSYGTGNGATIRAAQAAVVNANPNTVLIDTDSAALNGDNIHYSTSGIDSIANLLWQQIQFISPASPVNLVAPSVSGTSLVGQTLTLSQGTWTGNPNPVITRQWRRNGVAISGATGTTYTLVSDDANALIDVVVTATNSVGSTSINAFVPWTPARLSNLTAWYDAADAITITLNGSTVSQWRDKSGNGNHLSQASGAVQPAYLTNNLNGLAGINFNPNKGLEDQAKNVVAAFVQVVTRSPTSTWRWYHAHFDSRLNSNSRLGTIREATVSGFHTNPLPSSVWQDGVSITPGTDGFSTVDQAHLIGIVPASGRGNPTAGIGIGNYDQTVDGGSAVEYETVVLSSIPTLSDRQKLEGYLAWKWGTVANLPAGHPFKTNPPTV